MRDIAAIEQGYVRITDFLFRYWPRRRPSAQRLADGRLVAHRGAHDNITVLENTLAAFEQAADAGVWGIELDVRWTRDAVPVVLHDPDLARLHGVPAGVDTLTWRQLRREAPAVPALSEVVTRFGGRLHLMLEIKPVTRPDPATRNQTLQEVLAPLQPATAFHLMALAPGTLAPMAGFPPSARIAIAYHWPDGFSRWVAAHRWGGVCSHFALMRTALIRRHHALGQRIGTGFAASRNCLYREIQRGVDWIFSNNAHHLQRFLHPPR
ncbi:glycerophosphodiester phosphodiesterase [Desulfatitalea alkaliphila]|uniref:GP-PDE domain-containing protein n=1 Tax=Desulfatitalea alkaliphila TaxID=2929485 RepID=A0AA41R241_9BACT|nr:glycerophosphodiester phosphodiesterase family protein [Desulfatitalea alkaliphila]MCJ8500331.1 hypothetical protein [Desulfatitalea alkaliphila]